jgi:predicted metal-dependent phosphotriesterase family hydrolase
MLGAGVASTALPRVASAEPSFPEGAVIRTIVKDYPPGELGGGATLFHEHMSLGPDFLVRFRQYAAEAQAVNRPPNVRQSEQQGGAAPPTDLSFMRDMDLMTEELAIAKREGIACIADAGHPDMGRDIGLLRQISLSSGMPIVAGGGFYTQPFYPREISTISEEQIFQALMEQVEADPIGAFGEVGSWDYMTKDERKVFRAIGRAHLATNIPIFTHTGIPGKSALEQLDILEDVGVDPKHVVIGHLGNLVDPNTEVHRAICRRGAFVGFDRQGGPNDDHAGYAEGRRERRGSAADHERQPPSLPSLRTEGEAQGVGRLIPDDDKRFGARTRRGSRCRSPTMPNASVGCTSARDAKPEHRRGPCATQRGAFLLVG